MTQSLSKIGVQFIADMSDMVSKMSGMSDYTARWAEKTAAMLYNATKERKQESFIAARRQAEINEYNERGQRELEMSFLKNRLEDEQTERRKKNIDEIARYDQEVMTRLAAERDNLYNQQQEAARQRRRQEETERENALTRQLRLAKLTEEAEIAVGRRGFNRQPDGTLGTPAGIDPYEEDRRAREKAKADRIAEDTEKANKAERDRQAALNLSNKMQEEANNLVMRARTATERYNEEIARLNSLNTHKNVLTGKSFLSEQDYLRLKTRLILETIRQQQATSALTNAQRYAVNGFGGVTGAMTQLSFAAEDFVQVMSMGGGVNMALMSASNNLTMVARALIPTTAAFAGLAAVAIPMVLIGLGSLIRYLSQAKDESERLRNELELIRNAASEDFDLGLRSRQRNFEQMLKDMRASADAEKQIQDLKSKQIDLEEELAVKRRNAMREIDAQVESTREATEAIRQEYIYRRVAAAENHDEVLRLMKEEEEAVKTYAKAREQLMSTQINNAIDAQVALQRFLVDTANIPGVDTSNIQKILEELESGTLGSFEAIRQALEEINKLQENQKDVQERLKELKEEEAQRQAGELKAEQDRLEAKREQLLLMMKMNDEQKKMYDLRQRQQEFVGFDPQAAGVGFGFAGVAGAAANAAMQQQADQLGLQFLIAEQARLQKEMQDAVQQPPVAGKMEQSAFQAQADAMRQVAEAANRKTDTKQEAMVRHLANISAAIQNGGVIVNVVP